MSKYTEEREKYLLSNTTGNAKFVKELLVKKLLVFDKLIALLVEWKTQNKEQSEEEVLKDLTFIPLMKCLYIVCLLSVHKKDIGLFGVFNEFKAYQYGPVDEDCYYRIDELPHYKIDENNEVITKREGDGEKEFIGRFGLTETDYNNIMTDDLVEPFNMLEKAVTDLKNALYFPSFKEKNTLIDLTHRELWEKAYKNNPDKHEKMDSDDKFALFKEARGIRGVIAA